MRRSLIASALAVLMIAGCTSGESGTGNDGSSPAAAWTAAAPGVSDDSLKIGITFLDFASIRGLVSIDQGDLEGAYRVLIEEINDAGGIHGRRIEPVYAPVNPVGTASADEACLRMTQDEQVFLVMGFFLQDTVLCNVETNSTAVIGGTITPERLARARAPWFAVGGSSDLELDVIRAMHAEGDLDGKLAVVTTGDTEAQLRNEVEPLLADLGVEPTDVGVITSPDADLVAQAAAVGVMAERFRASGVEKVLVVGNAGLQWANGVEPTSYRPQLLFTNAGPMQSYVTDAAGRDLSVLEGSIGGGEPLDWEEPRLVECADRIGAALGVPMINPELVADGEPEHMVSASEACRNMALLTALLERAGRDLDYRSFAEAAEGLQIEMPGYRTPLTYGAGFSADGDIEPKLMEWDPISRTFIDR